MRTTVQREEGIARGTSRYGTLRNSESYIAECGHCGANTQHDAKTHRCVLCGAKNDTVSNDNPPTESELREYHAKNHSGKFIDCEKCANILGA